MPPSGASPRDIQTILNNQADAHRNSLEPYLQRAAVFRRAAELGKEAWSRGSRGPQQRRQSSTATHHMYDCGMTVSSLVESRLCGRVNSQ